MSLFEPVFAGLNRHEVRYVVVGGVAVVLHGHPRLTGDLDLAIDLSPPAATTAFENPRSDPAEGDGRPIPGCR